MPRRGLLDLASGLAVFGPIDPHTPISPRERSVVGWNIPLSGATL